MLLGDGPSQEGRDGGIQAQEGSARARTSASPRSRPAKARIRLGWITATQRIQGLSAKALARSPESRARNSSRTVSGIRTSPNRSRRRSSRPIAHRAARGVLFRTTGPPGIGQIPFELFRLFAEWRKTVLPQQEQEGHPRDTSKLRRQARAELSGFIELQGQEEAGFSLKLLRIFLQSPEHLGRVRDGQLVHHKDHGTRSPGTAHYPVVAQPRFPSPARGRGPGLRA